uniref:TAFII55 protein conserved region domain-containing protein n=1 Tax=Panagrolaimus sp. JU765 TaxID=591449 RepID=A0AC34QGT8_9BILA
MSKKQRKAGINDSSDPWHAILRIPNTKVEKFDKLIANHDFSKGDDVSLVKLKFQDNARRGQIKIGDEVFGFVVRELPCIIEICKVFNNSDVVKIDDVTQLLFCSETDEVPPIKPDEIEDDNQIVAIKEERIKIHRHPHGLTPPMKNVVKHRFRKTKKSRYIDAPEIESQLRGLF